MEKADCILVTGAAGHLGSHMAEPLLEAGYKLSGTDIVPPVASWPSDAPFHRLDLAHDDLPCIVRETDIIVHCASIHPWKPYADAQYHEANIQGTWNLYKAAEEAGVDRIVMTSSIAAIGYHGITMEACPVGIDAMFPLGDLYSLTKHVQEDIARMSADAGTVRTIALRPPPFMPREPLETGRALTGVFAVVSDMAAAHVAATNVLSGRQDPGTPLPAFSPLFCTNSVPYTREDMLSLGPDRNVAPLVEKYWPDAFGWLADRGYQSPWIPAFYDLAPTRELLGWEPAYNFEQWFAEQTA